ncbi:MAG TPA: hypothetical protein EYP88_08285 [Anaerolineales bacterium]|nr:hypothetical protein [Anaerolineales bacterium]
MSLLDLVGAALGFVLTLAIFSYIWGDNALFRIASYLFVGVAAGYAAIMVIGSVILPQLVFPFIGGNRNEQVFALLFLLLSALMLAKISHRLTKLGNSAVAYLVGVGAAAAIGGAVTGTIFPQSAASMRVFSAHANPLNALVILAGTLSVLLYFQFSASKKTSDDDTENQRSGWMESISDIGRVFIAITFAALFTGVYLASITALIERVSFLWNFITGLIF